MKNLSYYLSNNYVLSVATGFLLFLCFPKVHWHFLIWFSFIPLFWIFFHENNPFKIALFFFISGWVFHSLVLNWLIVNMFWVGEPAFIGYQLLCLGLSVFWGIYSYVMKKIFDTRYRSLYVYFGGMLWVFMEWLQGNLFTGFGWCNLGYSQGPNLWFVQWAHIGSVSMLSFFIIVINFFLVLTLERRHRWWIYGIQCFLILLIAHVVGYFLWSQSKEMSKDIKVGVIQPNFSQEMKFDPFFYDDMLNWTIEYSELLLKNNSVDVLFWPEALILGDYRRSEVMERLTTFTRSHSVHLITGSTRIDDEGKDFNSSIWVAPSGEVMDYYDKVHLAPFGEYLPLSNVFPFLRTIIPFDVNPGSEQKVFHLSDSLGIGPLICFEVLFTDLACKLKQKGATSLAVLTNLSWFGATNALSQELEICRMRAIETRLPVVHCTNSGISGVFSPNGRFYPAKLLIGKTRLFKYDQIDENPSISVRTRLAGVFDLPEDCPSLLDNVNLNYVPFIFGIFSIIFILIHKLNLKAKMNNVR